jgi:NADPH-dependent curcumin reductase CurA
MPENRVVRLKSRPVGLVTRDNFDIGTEELPGLEDGQILVKIQFVSLDPAMRGWLAEGKSYVEPVGIGDVMRSYSAGIVEESRHPDFAPGVTVAGMFGVQEYAIVDSKAALRVDTEMAPLERWIGGLGMPGITAYFGLLDIGNPKEGETLVVSAASGAVGSIVGQIGKLKGLRVVGIAGGPEKCKYIVDELGFDAAVDYKAGNLRAALKENCPNGIDIYFENVGGEITDTAMNLMNIGGRVPVCGMISVYNATEMPPGLQSIRSVLVNRLRVQGFIVFDFAKRYPEAVKALGEWHAKGLLKMREDVRDGGIDAFPDVLNMLYSGENNGKLVLRV